MRRVTACLLAQTEDRVKKSAPVPLVAAAGKTHYSVAMTMPKPSQECGLPGRAQAVCPEGPETKPGNAIAWSEHRAALAACLDELAVTDRDGIACAPDEGFRRWLEAATTVRHAGGCVFLVGNGASASMASHFATDLAKNGCVRTQVFTDLSLVTALGNDIRFEEIYAEPLRWYMTPGDILVAISSSGNSPNIVRAVDVARELGGFVATLSGFAPANAIRRRGDLNFYIPAPTYGLAETGHASILHHWMDLMECCRKKEVSR
ncbi:SIS domain-containing protein [Solidesulfovibrio sp. C21]